MTVLIGRTAAGRESTNHERKKKIRYRRGALAASEANLRHHAGVHRKAFSRRTNLLRPQESIRHVRQQSPRRRAHCGVDTRTARSPGDTDPKFAEDVLPSSLCGGAWLGRHGTRQHQRRRTCRTHSRGLAADRSEEIEGIRRTFVSAIVQPLTTDHRSGLPSPPKPRISTTPSVIRGWIRFPLTSILCNRFSSSGKRARRTLHVFRADGLYQPS